MPGVDLKAYLRVGLTSATVSSGVQLMSTRVALAHADHKMTEPSEPSEPLDQTAAPAEQSTVQPESATSEASAQEKLPGQAHSDMEEAMPSMADHHGNGGTVLEVPATQKTTPATEAGFSFGLGESLLGLVIVGPVVLMALKKRF